MKAWHWETRIPRRRRWAILPAVSLFASCPTCLLTSAQKKLTVNNVRVERRIRFSTSLVTEAKKSADLRGNCDGLETRVLIDSPEPPEKIQALTEVSESACMALQSIINQVPQFTIVRLNGEDF